MSAIAIIPARYDSTRFPGKALADRTGKPLIQHVFERARDAASVDAVIIATDDDRIRGACEGFGANVIMTRADHPNGTSRIAEAVEALSDRPDMIVNVQGDEPEIEPRIIDLAVQTLQAQPECVVSTIASPFTPSEDVSSPDIVKVVVNDRGRAMYFSRAAIPYRRADGAAVNPLRHVGLYVYRTEYLAEFVSRAPTPLEQAEQLEQLRVLEHGDQIAVAITQTHHCGIDTPAQYDAFVKRTVG